MHEPTRFRIKFIIIMFGFVCCSVLLYQKYALVQSSPLRSMLQSILYTDKWVLTLQWGALLCFKQLEHTEMARMRESAPGLDLRVGKSDSKLWVFGMRREEGKGGQSSVRQSSSAKAFQSFVIHFGLPLLTLEWTCLALQGNGEGSRACCIVVQGKQGSNAHDQNSPRNGKGEDPAQRWTRRFVIGHTREAEMWGDLMSTDDLLVLQGCNTQCLFSLCLCLTFPLGPNLAFILVCPNSDKALEKFTCILYSVHIWKKTDCLVLYFAHLGDFFFL